ncbi:MAG: DNA-directed RNA polymerase subunit alpha C-terminal domain-containing protein [bacterium]|nr:DNA-directed RNA polymerase subunit alpha C-terminal domain-containing protein [bacterium]
MAVPRYLHHLSLKWLHWPCNDRSIRIINILEENGIFTVGQLVKTPARKLLKFQNFGPLCLTIIRGLLAKVDLKLEDD